MKKYSLEEIENLSNAMYYVTFERWHHWTTTRFGYTTREAEDQYKILKGFPRKIKGNESMLGKVIPVALEIVNELQNCAINLRGVYRTDRELEEEVRKLVYQDKDSEERKEIVINLHRGDDILTYAALLKREITTVLLLKKVDNVHVKMDDGTSKYMDIFEGDIFNTNDDWYGIKSNVYVALPDGFKRLLYIKGKGYLMNGKLNYDSGSYSGHVLSADWVKVGNVYLEDDLVKLIDSNDVCGRCKGEKWINKGMETIPCSSCGCTGVKKN